MAEMRCFVETELGKLYQADCTAWLRTLPSGEADLVFADLHPIT